MTNISKITPDFSVTSQIQPGDLAAISELGVRTIINCRPDNEEAAQPSGQSIEAAAQQVGLNYRYIPVDMSGLNDQSLLDFEAAVSDLQGPVLGFCKSGMRAAALWALTESVRLDPMDILRHTENAGFDLKALEPQLMKRRSASTQRPSS